VYLKLQLSAVTGEGERNIRVADDSEKIRITNLY
jgi:hypothetical protein